MKVALPIHFLLRVRRDERREEREQVEERQQHAAGDGERALAELRQKIRAGDCGGEPVARDVGDCRAAARRLSHS